jgi:SPP1 gp7 family putative phage head morphogenesis protein
MSTLRVPRWQKRFEAAPPKSTLRVPVTKGIPWGTPIAVHAKPVAPRKRGKPRAIRPNAGLEATYRRSMTRLVDEMDKSVRYWVTACYRKNEPEVALAMDELPAQALLKAVRSLAKRWQKRFEAAAPKLAEWFAESSQTRSDAVLRKILRDGGFSVRWKMTKAMRDAMQATIGEQVGLIKSIPSQYFTQVEGMVMRSVAAGRDLAPLSRDLQKQYGVTKRRAALIARDQNNKATATLTRVRQIEANIPQATWLHSGGGREPRPTHVANSGKVYDVAKGWFDPAIKKWIWPGTEINCRCVSRPVVKGFS